MSVARSPSHIGARRRKIDADQLLSGTGRFVADIQLPGMLHAAVVRSSQAHAEIGAIDVDRALRYPGVRLVLTGTEAQELTDPIPHFIDPASRGGQHADVYCLAAGKTTYFGQPLAAVVAETRQAAHAAADLVSIDYKSLAAVLDAEAALLDEAPIVHPGWKSNRIMRIQFESGDVEGTLRSAQHVLSDEFHIQRYTTAPMEPRSYLANWDAETEQLTLYATTQNPHVTRWMLSKSLRQSENRIRVVAPRLGGSFGLKMAGHPEETLIPLLSILTRAPVKWTESRAECFLAGGREQIHRFQVGFNDDGVIEALKNVITANAGSLSAQPGWAMANITALTFPSGYSVANCGVTCDIVATNKSPSCASRGFGKEASTLVIEHIVNLVARTLGMDPVEVRRRNLVPKTMMPHRMASGFNIDSGDFGGLIDMVVEQIGYADWKSKQALARGEGRYIGVGVAFELTPEGSDSPGTFVGGFDTSTVRMSPTGAVTVLTGVTAPGGGNETAIAQIVAECLTLDPYDVRVVQGDTDVCPFGFGNFGGRSTLVGGASAALAARDLRSKLAVVGSAMLGVPDGEVQFADGSMHGGGRTVSFAEAARTVYTMAFSMARHVDLPLEATRTYRPDNIVHERDANGRIQPYPTYSSGVYAAVVEVDVETGVIKLVDLAAVHDCGVMINPDLVEGQTRGAIVMGVGAALSEQIVHNGVGILLTDRFKTYLLPRAGDLPRIQLGHQVTPSPFSLLGTKGAGEAGVGGTQAAVVAAIESALEPFGVQVRRMPITPPAVLDLLREATRAHASD